MTDDQAAHDVPNAVEPVVEFIGVGKRFAGVQALRDVHLSIAPGEVHALVGENGAGKSTLGKILIGAYRPDDGVLRVKGEPRDFSSPHDALAEGVTGIAQEISLVPERSAMENAFLGREPRRLGVLDNRALRRQYAELQELTQFDIPADAIARTLSVADQQRLEIMRAIARRAQVIVMDEPTAALTNVESERLFDVVRWLRRQGRTVVYVSHFLPEVLALADHVTVLRDGEVVRTCVAADETPASLITSMLGRPLTRTFPPKSVVPADAAVRLRVTGASRAGAFEDVSFDVRAGEIVGLAGLVGAGRSEIARGIFGADATDGGDVELDGELLDRRSPRDSVRRGLVYLTESRKDDGLLFDRSAIENVTLPHLGDVANKGVLRGSTERRGCRELLERVKVTVQAPNAPVRELSGGNQQKVLFARWLYVRPKVFIADEPTRGVDIGAKVAIYELLKELADQGMAIVIISSEHEELIGMANRVLVIRAGRIAAEFEGAAINEENIVSAALTDEGANRVDRVA